MPKRKSGAGELGSIPTPSLASLDAALDLLACDTFGRLETLATKFETAAGVQLNDGVLMRRWEEAAKRYWVMKSIDDLSCTGTTKKQPRNGEKDGEVMMEDGDVGSSSRNSHRDGNGYARPLPQSHHPGAVRAFSLDADEEQQWRRWTPRVNDVVLAELQDGVVWPAKIIDKKVFLQGRTSIPRGNHFYTIRIYCEDIAPTLTVKSRMIPFHLRSSPPLLASSEQLGAYNHAQNPTSFDAVAGHREQAAAYARAHPGVHDESGAVTIAEEKDKWKKFVNWLMDERRVEKLRNLNEERDKRLKEVTKTCFSDCETNGCADGVDEGPISRKRRVGASMPPFTYSETTTVHKVDGDPADRGGIFRVTPLATFASASSSQGSSSSGSRPANPMAAYIRPALAGPHRPNSPRRTDRRRNGVFSGLGDYSPRSRGSTYTPPRVLPSGDETAPFSPSPAPSLKSFDFCSPLSSKTRSTDDDIVMSPRKGSVMGLDVVREEEGEEGEWTLVKTRTTRTKRAGSAPCEKAPQTVPQPGRVASDDLVL